MASEEDVICESWLYKLSLINKKKSFKIGSHSWKKKYFSLKRSGQQSYLEWFDKKPKTTLEKAKDYTSLWPEYKIEKKSNVKNKEYVCEVTTKDMKFLLAADCEVERDRFVFHMQTQTQLRDTIEGQCFTVRPQEAEDLRKIGARGAVCLLHISPWGLTLALQVSRAVLAQWPLTCIKYYVAKDKNSFLFEAGRRSPMGAGHYVFYTKSKQHIEMYEILDHYVLNAAGLLEQYATARDSRHYDAVDVQYGELQRLTRVQSDIVCDPALDAASRDCYDHIQLKTDGFEIVSGEGLPTVAYNQLHEANQHRSPPRSSRTRLARQASNERTKAIEIAVPSGHHKAKRTRSSPGSHELQYLQTTGSLKPSRPTELDFDSSGSFQTFSPTSGNFMTPPPTFEEAMANGSSSFEPVMDGDVFNGEFEKMQYENMVYSPRDDLREGQGRRRLRSRSLEDVSTRLSDIDLGTSPWYSDLKEQRMEQLRMETTPQKVKSQRSSMGQKGLSKSTDNIFDDNPKPHKTVKQLRKMFYSKKTMGSAHSNPNLFPGNRAPAPIPEILQFKPASRHAPQASSSSFSFGFLTNRRKKSKSKPSDAESLSSVTSQGSHVVGDITTTESTKSYRKKRPEEIQSPQHTSIIPTNISVSRNDSTHSQRSQHSNLSQSRSPDVGHGTATSYRNGTASDLDLADVIVNEGATEGKATSMLGRKLPSLPDNLDSESFI